MRLVVTLIGALLTVSTALAAQPPAELFASCSLAINRSGDPVAVKLSPTTLSGELVYQGEFTSKIPFSSASSPQPSKSVASGRVLLQYFPRNRELIGKANIEGVILAKTTNLVLNARPTFEPPPKGRALELSAMLQNPQAPNYLAVPKSWFEQSEFDFSCHSITSEAKAVLGVLLLNP